MSSNPDCRQRLVSPGSVPWNVRHCFDPNPPAHPRALRFDDNPDDIPVRVVGAMPVLYCFLKQSLAYALLIVGYGVSSFGRVSTLLLLLVACCLRVGS